MAEDKPVSLLALARERNRRQGPDCGVGVTLRSHPKAPELTELLEALSTKEIRYSVAAEVCKEAGLELTADTLSRHTRRKCSCL